MDESSQQNIRRRLGEYLTDPKATYRDAASRFEALPVYSDMSSTLFITPSRQILVLSDEGAVSEEQSPAWRRVALVAAAERFPELKELLPTRPSDALDCSLCVGTGRVLGIRCGSCHGLGWPAPGLLPYHLSCLDDHPRLYQLSDGRFQIMEEGALAPLMVGYEYVLVERALAAYLGGLDLPQLDISEAVIFDARGQRDVGTHSQLHVGQRFSSGEIWDIEPGGERLLLMNDVYLFASPALKGRLDASPFKYLRFAEGLDGFAGGEE